MKVTIQWRNEGKNEMYFDKEYKPDTFRVKPKFSYFLLILKLKDSNQNQSKHQEVQFHKNKHICWNENILLTFELPSWSAIVLVLL